MIRILQLGKFYPIAGGVEKVMWDLTTGLNQAGVHCDMLCAKLKGDKVTESDNAIMGGHLICVPAFAKVAATMLSPAMVSSLKDHCREYDIIHVHHPDPMAALALRLSGFKGKVVLHWHSDIVSQKFLLRLYSPLQKWLIRRADVIVGTTPVYVRESPYLLGCQEKVTYVPIGIRPMSFSVDDAEALRQRFPGKKLILSVGRLVPYKGFRYLVEAVRYLPEEYQVIIGGQGPLKEELLGLARELGVADRISFEGFIPSESLPAYFGGCDLFVLASSMKTEAFGIVQIEAFSCGKPVVTTKIPGSGVSWVNEDGVSGINVPVGDAKALAEAVMKVTGTPESAEGFSQRARNRFDTCFTYETMISKIKTIYETQINS